MAYNTVDMTATSVDRITVKIAMPPIELLWKWLNEFPQNNFDDFGPKSEEELIVDLTRRAHRGEYVWMVYVGEAPVGVIGYAPMSDYCGMFHGICITREWHGRGVGNYAVREVIDAIFDMGYQKISASFFRDNHRVDAFLNRLGFRHEGILTRQTMRGGKPVDMLLMALFKEDWLCRSEVS